MSSLSSSQSNFNSNGNFRVNSPYRSRSGPHMNNTDQAGANWALMAIRNQNLKKVSELRMLIDVMHHYSGPSRWYRGGRREIMKTLNRIRNKRVSAARTAAANLRRARNFRSLARREVGAKRRRTS